MITPDLIPVPGLHTIHPDRADKYSPNLHAYLAAPDHRITAQRAQAWRHTDGTLWLGWMDDTYFIGARLNKILCYGRKEKGGAYGDLAADLTLIPDFWERYLAIGRCAIDTDHTTHFLNEARRYRTEGDTRTCLWCGQTQHLQRWTETIERTRWASSPASEL